MSLRAGRSRLSACKIFTKIVEFNLAACVVFAVPQMASAAESAKHFLGPTSTRCAAQFTLPAIDGSSRALAAEGGRPLLLHFFATWCEPCKAEFASLQQFFARRGDEVGVLAVNVGEVPGRVRSFLKETPVSFPVLMDGDRTVTKSWAVEGLPTTVVLDRSLTPTLAVTGDLDWTDAAVGREIDTALARAPKSPRTYCSREDSQ
jgi:thiol-disulfide isomerase/thioredoxin